MNADGAAITRYQAPAASAGDIEQCADQGMDACLLLTGYTCSDAGSSAESKK